MAAHDPIEILLVEDNPADARLTREGLEQAELDHRLHIVEDGHEALAFLRRDGEHSDAPRPDLVLLDLNLPRVNGHEVLRQVKDDPTLTEIPIVILSTSDDPDDIRTSYEYHASSYVTKPVDYDVFMERVHKIGEFFYHVAHTPRRRTRNGRG